jgi:hypothetical protein
MEAANVLFVPGFAYWLGQPEQTVEIVAFALAAIAAGGLLIVGALYWRAVDRQLRLRDRQTVKRALSFADRAQRPALIATGVAGVAFAGALAVQGWSSGVIAAGVLTLLAALEYVNYYHRQLQHFDNVSDFKRLVTGGGLRKSHMARDLAVFRGRSSAQERVAH